MHSRWQTFGTVAALWASWAVAAQAQQADPHAGHRAPAPSAAPADDRRLFHSDMSLMTGMTPRDPMAGMHAPGWQWMGMGVGRLG